MAARGSGNVCVTISLSSFPSLHLFGLDAVVVEEEEEEDGARL